MSPKLARATSIFLELFQCSPGRPDLKLLGEVSERFANLPWENLTKYLRKHRPPGAFRGVPHIGRLRRSEEVMTDHARYGTGGTCFSLTHTLRRIVTDLGFRAYPVMADMQHGPNIHCGLLVELEGRRFLLDPGYLVAEPVPLDRRKEVRVRLAGQTLEYRPLTEGDAFGLATINDRGEVTPRYRLRARRVPEADFLAFWAASFEANGMNGLHLNRITGEGRLSAHDLNLRIDTGRDKLNLKLRDDYVGAVAERFGIYPELVRRAFEAWERNRCPRA